MEGGVTTAYIGDYYEWRSDTTSTIEMKDYYAAGQPSGEGRRIAMRRSGVLTGLLGLDHRRRKCRWDAGFGTEIYRLPPAGVLREGQTRSGSVGTDRQYTGQISEPQLGLYFYNARFYDPYLARFISPDSIIPQPASPLAWDRYAYVNSNPINFLDPSGHLACSDDGFCGKLSDTSYQLHIFKEAITEVYAWEAKGIWNLDQLKKIYTAGRDIQTYVDSFTDGNGLKWMNGYLGGAVFVHGGLPGNNSFVMGNVIHLVNGWEKGPSSEMHIVHELTHVWDNNSAKTEGMSSEALWVGGGNADLLQAYLGGGIPSGIRWMNGTGSMPLEYQWGEGKYGDHSTADYFAESFMYMVYKPDAIPRSSWGWGADSILKAFIAAETSSIP